LLSELNFFQKKSTAGIKKFFDFTFFQKSKPVGRPFILAFFSSPLALLLNRVSKFLNMNFLVVFEHGFAVQYVFKNRRVKKWVVVER
jgi:hypothetical protein